MSVPSVVEYLYSRLMRYKQYTVSPSWYTHLATVARIIIAVKYIHSTYAKPLKFMSIADTDRLLAKPTGIQVEQHALRTLYTAVTCMGTMHHCTPYKLRQQKLT
jgi:hypothetical protein